MGRWLISPFLEAVPSVFLFWGREGLLVRQPQRPPISGLLCPIFGWWPDNALKRDKLVEPLLLTVRSRSSPWRTLWPSERARPVLKLESGDSKEGRPEPHPRALHSKQGVGPDTYPGKVPVRDWTPCPLLRGLGENHETTRHTDGHQRDGWVESLFGFILWNHKSYPE